MNTPNPAMMKKKLDELRASLPTPPVKDSSKKGSSTTNSSRGDGSGSNTPSSTKYRRKSSKTSTKSDTSARRTFSEGSGNTDRGRQNSNIKKTSSNDGSKKKFERRDHLTSRPLLGNDSLTALKASLERSEKPNRGGNSRAPHRVPRQTTSTGRTRKGNNGKKEEKN